MKFFYVLAQIATLLFVAPIIIMVLTGGTYILMHAIGYPMSAETFLFIMNNCVKFSALSLVLN
jgi:hypothetical protein